MPLKFLLTIQFSRNLQRGIVEMANGAAVDARKESNKVQDLVLADKRCEKKNKKAKDGVSKKVSTRNNKNMIIRSVDLNGSI
jgi:hypothetical protein